MSILRFINGKNRQFPQMKRILDYVMDPHKMRPEGKKGVGISCQDAFADMKFMKILYGKTGGRQYIHFVLSFDRMVDFQTAFSVCEEVLDVFNSTYQGLFAIHENTLNIHAHFVVNSVGVNGKKFRISKKDMLQFRGFINRILEKYNLRKIEKIEEIDEEDGIYEWDRDDEIYDNSELSLYMDDEAYEDNKLEEPNFPIWFDGWKPVVPIWFSPKSPITFFDKNKQEKKHLIWFVDEEE